MSRLSEDAAARKAVPIYSGFIAYFPDAMIEVAKISKAGNDQHNPGQPLHWAKHKSQDQLDCVARHLLDAGLDEDVTHAANMAWRAMAYLQILVEAKRHGMTVAEYNKALQYSNGGPVPCVTPSTTLSGSAAPAPSSIPPTPPTAR